MPRNGFKTIVDFGSPEAPAADIKRRLCAFVGRLQGPYEVEFRPRRNTRSLQQNRAYWALVVEPFFEFLREQDYEISSRDMAHELLRAKLLTVDVTNPETGEVIGSRVRSTTELSTEEFSRYFDDCRHWLLDFFGIVTADPEPNPERRLQSRPRVTVAEAEDADAEAEPPPGAFTKVFQAAKNLVRGSKGAE